MQAFNCRAKKWEYVEPAPLTDDEIAELEALAQEAQMTEPTAEERLEALESAMLELMGVEPND